MRRDPRYEQMGDIPQALRPETTEDAYGVDSSGQGYSNLEVGNMSRRVEEIRRVNAEKCATDAPDRNVSVRARFAQSAFNITEVSLQVLRANAMRKYFLVQNIGANDVYINFGNKAQVNNVKIVANGNYEPFVTPIDSISLICDPGNTSIVTVIEGVEVRPGGY